VCFLYCADENHADNDCVVHLAPDEADHKRFPQHDEHVQDEQACAYDQRIALILIRRFQHVDACAEDAEVSRPREILRRNDR